MIWNGKNQTPFAHNNEAIEKSRFLEKAFKQDDEHDIFKYESVDPYFGDDDGGSWNNTPLNWNMDPNFQ